MRYWAEVNEDNEVVFMYQLDMDNPSDVCETENRLIETFEPIRPQDGIMGGIGCVYIEEHNVFMPQKRFASWVFNPTTGAYEAPVLLPDLNCPYQYSWDEETVSWVDMGTSDTPIAGPVYQ